MIKSLNRAFKAFSKTPVNFAWASLVASLLMIILALAAFGVFVAYFMALAAFGQYALTDQVTYIVAAIIVLMFYLFAGGINAALAKAYSEAFEGKKTEIGKFYFQALKSAPSAFGITIIRDIVWLICLAPAVLLYLYALKGVAYSEVLAALYGIFITWLVHMLFTPALITSAVTGSGAFSSLKRGFDILKRKHVMFAGLYLAFAVSWLVNLIPILQLVGIFVLFPITYGAMITMVEG